MYHSSQVLICPYASTNSHVETSFYLANLKMFIIRKDQKREYLVCLFSNLTAPAEDKRSPLWFSYSANACFTCNRSTALSVYTSGRYGPEYMLTRRELSSCWQGLLFVLSKQSIHLRQTHHSVELIISRVRASAGGLLDGSQASPQ